MISTSVRRYDSLALWLIVLFSYSITSPSCSKWIGFVSSIWLSKNRNWMWKVSSRTARWKKYYFFFLLCLVSSVHISDISSEILFFQINLENSNKTLLDLQESYRLAITKLKEKEIIISKLLCSGKSTERSTQNLCFVLYIFFSHWQSSIYLSMHKQKIL